MKTDTIQIEGMFCGHCEIAVQDAARKLPGVGKAKASKRKKQMTVEYDSELVTIVQIIEAVEQTGYEVMRER